MTGGGPEQGGGAGRMAGKHWRRLGCWMHWDSVCENEGVVYGNEGIDQNEHGEEHGRGDDRGCKHNRGCKHGLEASLVGDEAHRENESWERIPVL